MKKLLRKTWQDLLRPRLRAMGFDVRRYPMKSWQEEAHAALFQWKHSGDESDEATKFILFLAAHLQESSAQLFQDLFVRYWLGDKRDGFFVEFGATDGVSLSNTKHLEADFGWRGILAEPARIWHDGLARNRTAKIDKRCVWSASGEVLLFNEVSAPELSTIESFSTSDHHAQARQEGQAYDVETVSLHDLLAQHDAPRRIDYLSIDTEGSELSILQAFDFSKYEIGILTIEHNYAPNRETIRALLEKSGYRRVFTEFSAWDDWYVRSPR